MVEEVRTSRRDLIARVATLELLIADLIDLLWQLDPDGMAELSRIASRDLDIQTTHKIAGAEHQRERLHNVLQERQRKLRPRRATAPRMATVKA